MDLQIKNENVQKILEIGEKATQLKLDGDPMAFKKYVAMMPESILGGYLDSLLEICDMNGIELDLTYSTLEKLPMALIMLFYWQAKQGYENERNATVIAKTLATWLTLLAMNEHGYRLSVHSYFDEKTRAVTRNDRPLWGDIYAFNIGKKRNVDLLPCCIDAMNTGTLLSPKGFVIQIDRVAEEYLRMTGVNLCEKGLVNILANGEQITE